MKNTTVQQFRRAHNTPSWSASFVRLLIRIKQQQTSAKSTATADRDPIAIAVESIPPLEEDDSSPPLMVRSEHPHKTPSKSDAPRFVTPF